MSGLGMSLLGTSVVILASLCDCGSNAGVPVAAVRTRPAWNAEDKPPASTAKRHKTAKSSRPSSVKRPVIVYIESRNCRIAVHSGSRYTIVSKNGEVLSADVTDDELKARYPTLHQIVEYSYASAWAGL